MFRLFVWIVIIGLSGCTQLQRDNLLDYVARSGCASQYQARSGSGGPQSSYLNGMHECRYAGVDRRTQARKRNMAEQDINQMKRLMGAKEDNDVIGIINGVEDSHGVTHQR